MNLSKFKALWSLITGGWAGLATYILEAVNRWLATLDKSRLAEVSKIVIAISGAVRILLDTFLPIKYKAAATLTITALDGLANALADGELTKDELDSQISAIEAAIKAWKEVS